MINKIIVFFSNKGRTNSCADTVELRMPNNHSKTGFGYKHRPGLSFELI